MFLTISGEPNGLLLCNAAGFTGTSALQMRKHCAVFLKRRKAEKEIRRDYEAFWMWADRDDIAGVDYVNHIGQPRWKRF
jgi:hypothetical protein